MLGEGVKKWPCDDVQVNAESDGLKSPFANLHRPFAVSESTECVYQQTKEAMERSKRVLILGGDHSVAIGSVAGVTAVQPETAVIWFDAHADINTALSTASGKIHGCPVSFLLGHSDSLGVPPFEWLRKAQEEHVEKNGHHFLTPDRIGFIGLRDVEPSEQVTLQKEGIHCAYMHDVREKGLQRAIIDLLAAVDPQNNRRIHLSFDVDGIDPEYTPSTGTPVPGGLTLDQAIQVVEMIRQTGRLFSMDIVEVNCKLGSEEDKVKTIKSTLSIIKAAFC